MASRNPESLLTAKLLKRLRSIPRSHWVKVHSDPMGNIGQPDINGCVDGRSVHIEVKIPGRASTVTPLQRVELEAWRDAGAAVAVITSLDELEAWLQWAGIVEVDELAVELVTKVRKRMER